MNWALLNLGITLFLTIIVIIVAILLILAIRRNSKCTKCGKSVKITNLFCPWCHADLRGGGKN